MSSIPPRWPAVASAVTLRRVLASGWLSFRRNGWLSTATVLVMMLTLVVIGGLLLTSVIADRILGDLESKIDISVSFKDNMPETAIAQIKQELEALGAVREITYVSAREATEQFKEKHQDDPAILASLEELGDEYLLPARLDVKAQSPADLATIAEFLKKKDYPSIKESNYFENQKVIERLSSVIRGVRSVGVSVVLALAFVAMLVAFTTVRLAIYTSREEISIMRLVGATSWYIRGPFMITGMLYGALAAIAASLVFFPLVWIATPKLKLFLPAVNLQRYFLENFPEFFLILLLAGAALGVGSSVVAIRRYLKI